MQLALICGRVFVKHTDITIKVGTSVPSNTRTKNHEDITICQPLKRWKLQHISVVQINLALNDGDEDEPATLSEETVSQITDIMGEAGHPVDTISRMF